MGQLGQSGCYGPTVTTLYGRECNNVWKTFSNEGVLGQLGQWGSYGPTVTTLYWREFNNVWKPFSNEGVMGQLWQLLTGTGKVWRVRKERPIYLFLLRFQYVFFFNLQKMCLTYRSLSNTRYPLWSTDWLYIFKPDDPPQ